MAQARFDPGGFYQFDLREGSVRTKDGGRVLVLSDTALGPLVSAAAESGAIGALVGLGNELGTLARANLGADPRSASPEEVVAHASAVVSLFGWGKLSFAHWGSALVVAAEGAPELDHTEQALAALLTGLLSALGDQPADCVPVGGGQFVVVAPDVADQVRSWVAGGTDIGGIVGRLGVSS
jgi:hypothetical protein